MATADKIKQLIEMMIRPLRNRVYMIVSRAVVELAKDDRSMQVLKMTILAGEDRDDIEHFQPFGFTGVALPGAESIIVCPQGNRDNMIAIVVDDRRFRKKDMQAGESAQYDSLGNYVYLAKEALKMKHQIKAEIDSPAIDLGVGATEAVIKGNTYQAIYNAHSHVGNSGYNTSSPIIPLTGTELSLVSKTL